MIKILLVFSSLRVSDVPNDYSKSSKPKSFQTSDTPISLVGMQKITNWLCQRGAFKAHGAA
jgi:hypothetical protein